MSITTTASLLGSALVDRMIDIALERRHFQRHLRQEISRSERFGRVFVLLVLEANPSAAGLRLADAMKAGLSELRRTLRTYDVESWVFEDTLAALMLGTESSGGHAAELRLRSRLANIGGQWTLTSYAFPEQRAEIESLSLFSAA
jgi:hypothetical protein